MSKGNSRFKRNANHGICISGDSRYFDMYLEQCCRSEPMTKPEEQAEFARYAAGDESARERILLANQRFVLNIARYYSSVASYPVLDLVQCGNIGMIKAFDRFKVETDNKFISYAVWWIRQEIQRAVLYSSGPVQLPLNSFTFIKKAQIAHEVLFKRGYAFGDITPEMVASEASIPVGMAASYMALSTEHRSLEMPVSMDSKNSFSYKDRLESPDSLDDTINAALDADLVNRILADLPQRKRTIFEKRYGLNGEDEHTLDEVGEHLGLSKERVRQIQSDTLADITSKQAFRYVQEVAL